MPVTDYYWAADRMKRPFVPILVFLTLAVLGGIAVAEEVELDPFTGFKMTGDWQLVRAHCIGCHSAKLVTGQRGDAEQWLKMIRWMQEQQGLWQFDPDTERRIVAYLADNYPPEAWHRRAPIPAALMPPNPYDGSTSD